jgi:VanZ like family
VPRFRRPTSALQGPNPATFVVLPLIGLIALSCTDIAGAWCSNTFDLGFRSLFADSPGPFGTIRFIAEKSIHVTLFTTLGFTLLLLFQGASRKTLLALVTGCTLGCCSELFQRLFPTRDPAIRDVLINSCSVSAGVAIASCMQMITAAGRHASEAVGVSGYADRAIADLQALSFHTGIRSGEFEPLNAQGAHATPYLNEVEIISEKTNIRSDPFELAADFER